MFKRSPTMLDANALTPYLSQLSEEQLQLLRNNPEKLQQLIEQLRNIELN